MGDGFGPIDHVAVIDFLKHERDGHQGQSPSETISSIASGSKEKNDTYTQRNSHKNDGDEKREFGSLGFDFLFVRRFCKIHPFLFHSIKSLSTLLFTSLIALCFLGEFVVYHVGSVPSRFYKVLGDKDLPGFWNATFISLGLILAVAIVKSTIHFTQKLLTATWRLNLCRALHARYFQDINYYQLNLLDNLIDNPDQRMTQDVDKFTDTYCEMLPKIIMAPFVIAYYSYKGYVTVGWEGPTSCFIFFFVGAIINKILMGPVVRYVIKQERCEGDFRFLHMLVRVNSEPIAFNDAGLLEASNTNASLDKLIKTQRGLYLRQYFLNTSVKLFDYLASIVSYLVIALPIFSGTYDDLPTSDLSALISQNSFVNMYLIYQFTQLVDLSGKFTDVVGVTHRIAQLLERLQILSKFRFDANGSTITINNVHFKNFGGQNRERRDGKLIPAWNIHKVTFSSPDQSDPLIRDLDLTISVGEPLLVIGNSSAGKSSLLRILKGLWLPETGRVERFYGSGPNVILYCPQKPYLTCGSLRNQICYPLKLLNKCFSSEEDDLLISYMRILELQPLLLRVGGLDAHVPWNVYESFSPGEIQRICLLRVLYHKPLIAVLDEATASVTEEMEEKIYTEFHRLGITTLSIGHRKSLRKYHDKILVVGSNGVWTLGNLRRNDREVL